MQLVKEGVHEVDVMSKFIILTKKENIFVPIIYTTFHKNPQRYIYFQYNTSQFLCISLTLSYQIRRLEWCNGVKYCV